MWGKLVELFARIFRPEHNLPSVVKMASQAYELSRLAMLEVECLRAQVDELIEAELRCKRSLAEANSRREALEHRVLELESRLSNEG